MARLTYFGSGLLLGAGLGVIIPEGVEALTYSQYRHGYVPTTKIAFSLLTGFTFMLFMEKGLSLHSHSNPSQPPSVHVNTVEDRDLDLELRELEEEQGLDSMHNSRRSTQADLAVDRATQNRAYALSFGLVLHALADGLALGSSVFSDSGSTQLSFIVFLALVIHKAPTALALTTSLLAMSLPKADCKKHVIIFSLATPIGALTFYILLWVYGSHENSEWTGLAMLISGGSFLYVATVLQPVSRHIGDQVTEDLGRKSSIFFIAFGIFVPITVSNILGHGHG